jgi:hypothetical protein
MADPTGEADKGALRLDFDRRLLLQFRGSAITSDAGLLPYRELDDAVGLTHTGADMLADARTGKNGRHRLAGLLRQSVFGRLAGYEDVNDAERLCRDPAMRWVVGERAITRVCRFGQPDGPLRNEVAEPAGEPCRSHRSARTVDRQGAYPTGPILGLSVNRLRGMNSCSPPLRLNVRCGFRKRSVAVND